MNLPDLRILPLEDLLPHELTDTRRVNPLIARLKDESVLRNPPIVAPLGKHDARFVVLDGANRTAAFRALNVPHIVAQVVDYDKVQLSTWHHVITACPSDNLLQQIAQIDGMRLLETDLMRARAMLARREAIAFVSVDEETIDERRQTINESQSSKCDESSSIVHRLSSFSGRSSVTILQGPTDIAARTELLHQLVDLYEGCAKVQRTTSDNIAEARQAYPDASAIMVFPRYEPAEIIDLVRSGQKVPAGITRHVLPLRALRLNYPMDILRSDDPLSRKQGHLTEWIFERTQSRRVRTYSEPTVLFDE